MKRMIDWVGRHQIAAFYIIAFLITWGLGFSFDLVMNREVFILAPLISVALCGPALAGILVTRLADGQPPSGRRRSFWIAFLISLAAATLIFLAHNTFLNQAPFSPVMVILAMMLAAPVAFVLSMRWSRSPGVRSYLEPVFRLRRAAWWCLAALGLVALPFLATIVYGALSGSQPLSAHRPLVSGLPLVGLVLVKFLYQMFFFNCSGEEIGWRGFALPRLQVRFSPLVASLVVTFFWLPWHFFLWQVEGQDVFTWNYWLEAYMVHLPASVLIGWLYNRSHGSILAAGVAHAAANTLFAFLPNMNGEIYPIMSCVLALILVLADRMWKRLPEGHPAVWKDDLKRP